MRMQDSQANCGVYALKNALSAIGIERTASELETACKTSATDGTSMKNLIRAVQRIEGCAGERLRETRRDVALLRLHAALSRGRPVILSWTTDEPADHWVAAVGLLGNRYLVADSGHNELVVSYGVEALEERWRANAYEGVIL